MNKHTLTTNPACGLCYCDVHADCEVTILDRAGFLTLWCHDCRIIVTLESVAHRLEVADAQKVAEPA